MKGADLLKFLLSLVVVWIHTGTNDLHGLTKIAGFFSLWKNHQGKKRRKQQNHCRHLVRKDASALLDLDSHLLAVCHHRLCKRRSIGMEIRYRIHPKCPFCGRKLFILAPLVPSRAPASWNPDLDRRKAKNASMGISYYGTCTYLFACYISFGE